MAITVKHKFVSAIPDAGDPTIVQPSNWNDNHDLVGTVPVANGGTGASTLTGYVKGNGTAAMTASATVPSTDVTGLGTMSTQNANNIAVTGGTMSGVAITGYIPTTEKAVANGVATLDGSGTVPIAQLPAAVLGALSYQGTWNASTNTPTLTSSVGTKGYYYVVNVAGSTNLNGITDWVVGDWAVYNGTAWQKVDNTDAVTSVNGYTGTVVLTAADVNAVPYTGATGAVDLNAKSLTNVSNLGVGTTTVPTISMRAVGNNTSTSRIAMRGYSSDANSSAIRVTKFRGTAGAPQAPQSGDSLGKFELAGYGTTSSEGYPQASLEGVATEAWGAIARGTKAVIKVTPNTTTTQVTALTINQDSTAVFANTVTANGVLLTGNTGTVTSVAATAGTGISVTGSPITTSGTLSITNTAPDQTVVLTAGTGISTTGTYPNFTITNTSPSSGGTVTSVTGTSPVVSSGGNTPAISMPAATTSVSGYLTSTDWNTFNGKQPAGTYVNSVSGTATRITSTGGTTPIIDLASGVATAGTTGSSTLIPVVTIDTYGRVTGITTASNPQGTVTSVTGTAPVVSSGGATPAISMPAATTSVSGYLTSTDWTTFNNKGSGTVTSVGGTGTVNGITLTGTVTSSGNLTLGGTLSGVSLTTQVSGTLPLANGGTASTTAPQAINTLRGWTTTATAAGTTTLTAASSYQQEFTGTLAQTVVLPVVSTLALGWSYEITNNSTGSLTIQSSGLNTIGTVTAGTTASLVCVAITGTTAASWDFDIDGFASETGTGSVVRAASPTITGTLTASGDITTPVITVSNGIVCNANTISANYTIATGSNAMSAGPITVNTGVTVTVSTGSTWVVV